MRKSPRFGGGAAIAIACAAMGMVVTIVTGCGSTGGASSAADDRSRSSSTSTSSSDPIPERLDDDDTAAASFPMHPSTYSPTRADRSIPKSIEHSVVVGRSVEGRPIECIVFNDGPAHDVIGTVDHRIVDATPSPDTLLVIATIHGDEAAGTPLLRRFADRLRTMPELRAGRRVVLVPVANPDGFFHGRRTNVNGVDLNRNFEASNFRSSRRRGTEPLSEPESRVLRDVVGRYRPHRVVSLHQPVDVIDWDGPADALAHAMAKACGMRAKRIGSRPGSLGSWVGLDLGIPIITFELPRFADRLDDDELWRRYGPGLLVALQF